MDYHYLESTLCPLRKVTSQIEELLKEYKEEICIQIVLTSFSKELEPSAMLLTSMYLLNKESDYLRFLPTGIQKSVIKEKVAIRDTS